MGGHGRWAPGSPKVLRAPVLGGVFVSSSSVCWLPLPLMPPCSGARAPAAGMPCRQVVLLLGCGSFHPRLTVPVLAVGAVVMACQLLELFRCIRTEDLGAPPPPPTSRPPPRCGRWPGDL